MSSAIKRTQERYFEIFEDFFGDQYKKMRQTGKPAHDVAIEAARVYTDSMVEVELDLLHEELNRLWTGQIEQLRSEIRGKEGVKAVYGGSMTPERGLNFVKRAALLVDTMIIQDPASSFLKVSHRYNLGALIRRLVRNVLRILEIKDLTFCCSGTLPLVIVPTFEYGLSQTELSRLRKQRDNYAIDFCSEALGRRFESIQELMGFVSSQVSLEGLLRHMSRPEFFSNPDRGDSPCAHLRDSMNYSLQNAPLGYYQGLGDPKLLTDVFLRNTTGPLGGVCHILFECRSDVMKAEPVTDVTFWWRFLNWVFGYDSARIARALDVEPRSYGIPQRKLSADALVLNVLMRDDFKWLGNVPVKDIARLREKGEFKGIKDVFSDGIREMENTEPSELGHIVEQVKDNWNRAVDKHKKEVRKLRMDAGLSASAVIAGTLGAIVPVFSPFAIAGAGIGVAKLALDMAKLHEQRKRPVGIFLKAHNDPN